MTFLNNLNTTLERWHLLKHPFYQAWNDGTLKRQTLQIYAKEYYYHVAAFPRYISQIHALCSNLKARQTLLDNLIDEEKEDNNHPELWLRFAEGIGVFRDSIKDRAELESTQRLVEGFFDLVKTNYPTGLGALYVYERQTPEVSKSKINGLKKHYEVCDDRTLQFFSVHQQADEWHTEELVKLIEDLDESDKQKVCHGAIEGAKLLWYFLDGIRKDGFVTQIEN